MGFKFLAHFVPSFVFCLFPSFVILLDSRFHQAQLAYTPKKGRKNSAPNATRDVTFSPDGAVVEIVKSNPGLLPVMYCLSA